MSNIQRNPEYKERKWYNNEIFPLIPYITTKKSNEHNTSCFSFHWLFFKIWSLDTFNFELALVVDPSHWGVGITAILPYLRFVCTIPTHWKVGMVWDKWTSRKSKILKQR
jgi:hypothetical protein